MTAVSDRLVVFGPIMNLHKSHLSYVSLELHIQHVLNTSALMTQTSSVADVTNNLVQEPGIYMGAEVGNGVAFVT